jgi:hypothetical protein
MSESQNTPGSEPLNTHPADLAPTGVNAAPLPDDDKRMARIGVGCFTLFIGTISGAMIGVLVALGATFLTRCKPLEGLPACNWHIFAGWGALIGAISLPLLALSRLRRRERAGS